MLGMKITVNQKTNFLKSWSSPKRERIVCRVQNNNQITASRKVAAAAAAAKSLQSCPTVCNPIDGSPTGSPVPGIPQARILEWVAVSFSNA